MHSNYGIRSIPGVLDQLSLAESTEALSAQYHANPAFPHLSLDDLLPVGLLNAVLEEMSATDSSNWIHHHTRNIEKLGQKSAVSLGHAGFQLVALLHSAPVLYLLSEITGIWNLLPDPYLHGAGFSVIPEGGKFDVHVDLNKDETSGLTRRLALIIYLNHDWLPEYGGQLELYENGGASRLAAFNPIFNRTVLMEISDSAYHGITPVTGLAGRSRCSFMVYYNSAGAVLGKDLGVHNSMYAPTCYRPKPTFRSVMRKITPPALYDLVRRKIT